jgi:hypothetical protein
MTARDRLFDPSHVLVVTTSGDSAAEAAATAAAVEAVLDRSDTVALRMDLAALASDHPDLADRIREATDSEDNVLRAPVDRVRDALSAVLDLTDVHRFVALERLDAFRDGQPVLRYVPDHATFELDESAADGVADDVARAVVDEPAGLLPATVLADWYVDGTHYELAPPSLCVDGASCFDLDTLERITFDEHQFAITLQWRRDGGVLAAVTDRLGPDSPDEFRFDSPNRYAAVAAAFETVADALDVETTSK